MSKKSLITDFAKYLDPINIIQNQEIIWDKVYGSSSADFGNKILERPNGNIIILGDTNHQNPSEAIFDFLILETDPEGNPI